MTLQHLLNGHDIRIPLIAMSARGDIPMAVEMVRLGAVDFIEKTLLEVLLVEDGRFVVRPQQGTDTAIAEVITACPAKTLNRATGGR